MPASLRSSFARIAAPQDVPHAADSELVRRFRDDADQAAYAELVRRHGPMVFGVCRRVLATREDAEDAFQATFLVLAVKPSAIRPPDRVGAWLHGVATRAALKARRSAARRAKAERAAGELRRPPLEPDLWPVLDEALLALPEKYRLPVVECHLAGRSRREAAARLGCSEGTLSGRLARALNLLAARLARRGIGLPAAALAGVLSARPLSANVPVDVAASTVSVADLMRGGLLAPSGPVAALTRGVLRAMWWKKLTTASLAAIATGLLAAAVAALAPDRATADPPRARASLTLVTAPEPKPAPKWQTVHTVAREHAVTGLSVQKDSVAFADEGGNLLLWKVGAKDPRVLLRGRNDGKGIGPVACLHYTPDEKFLYFTPGNGAGIWRHDFAQARTYGVGGDGGITCVGFSADGQTWIETHSKKRVLWLEPNGWDGRNRPPADRSEFDAAITHAAMSDDGTRLVTVTDDGKIRILDRDGLKVAHTVEVKNLRANAVRFSPDGKLLAVVGENGFARLYDAAKGTEVAELKGPKGLVFDVAFSPDGRAVAAGGDDNVVRVWETKGGELTAVLDGHQDSVRAVRFGRDDSTIVTGSADKTLRVWQLKK